MSDVPARISALIAEDNAPVAIHRNHLPTEAINLLLDAQHEIYTLLRWKDEATLVLSRWDQVWQDAGEPGILGDAKWFAVSTHIRTLQAKLDAVRALFAEDRGTYYGYDDEGYTRWCAFMNLADEVEALLR